MNEELPDPHKFIVLFFNAHGSVVAVGDAEGLPFTSEEAAETFLTAYTERYPSVQAIVLPIVPFVLDT